MNTAAPTIRALELENQRLKADVAELSKALAGLMATLDAEPDYDSDFAAYSAVWEAAEKQARALIAKHGA